MEAHKDVAVPSPFGAFSLRLHADGRAEVLAFKPFEQQAAAVARASVPMAVLQARTEACSPCELRGTGPCKCPNSLRARQKNPDGQCPDKRWKA